MKRRFGRRWALTSSRELAIQPAGEPWVWFFYDGVRTTRVVDDAVHVRLIEVIAVDADKGRLRALRRRLCRGNRARRVELSIVQCQDGRLVPGDLV